MKFVNVNKEIRQFEMYHGSLIHSEIAWIIVLSAGNCKISEVLWLINKKASSITSKKDCP